jgi:hypothetical protein
MRNKKYLKFKSFFKKIKINKMYLEKKIFF